MSVDSGRVTTRLSLTLSVPIHYSGWQRHARPLLRLLVLVKTGAVVDTDAALENCVPAARVSFSFARVKCLRQDVSVLQTSEAVGMHHPPMRPLAWSLHRQRCMQTRESTTVPSWHPSFNPAGPAMRCSLCVCVSPERWIGHSSSFHQMHAWRIYAHAGRIQIVRPPPPQRRWFRPLRSSWLPPGQSSTEASCRMVCPPARRPCDDAPVSVLVACERLAGRNRVRLALPWVWAPPQAPKPPKPAWPYHLCTVLHVDRVVGCRCASQREKAGSERRRAPNPAAARTTDQSTSSFADSRPGLSGRETEREGKRARLRAVVSL